MSDFDAKKFDEAADKAEEELSELPDELVLPIAQWWYKWFGDAGHKRLGRILVGIAEKKEGE